MPNSLMPQSHTMLRAMLVAILNVSGGTARPSPISISSAAPSHGAANLVEDAPLAVVQDILLGGKHSAAKALATGNDGDFMDGKQAIVDDCLHDGMTNLVIGDDLAVSSSMTRRLSLPKEIFSRASSRSIRSTTFFLLRAAINAPSLRRLARSAPENPAVARARELRSTSFAKLDLLGMHLENGFPALKVREINHDLPVEAAWPEKRVVEDVRPVGGGDNITLVAVEAIHLRQEVS